MPSDAAPALSTAALVAATAFPPRRIFASGHIPGAILIPDYEIAEKAEDVLKDKNQLILVYCRSGRRSKLAAETLANLGYANVSEFGGIIDWKGETVTE